MGLSGSSSSVAKQSSLGSGRGLTYFRACVKSKFYGAFVPNFEHPDTLIDFHTDRAQLEQHQA